MIHTEHKGSGITESATVNVGGIGLVVVRTQLQQWDTVEGAWFLTKMYSQRRQNQQQ